MNAGAPTVDPAAAARTGLAAVVPGHAAWSAAGALGAPLAFVALPLYVVLPQHYATEFGLPLAVVGSLLLATRALDALADPLIGWLLDRVRGRDDERRSAAPAPARQPGRIGARPALWQAAWPAALLLAVGFAALFFPPAALLASARQPGLLLWCAAALMLTYLSYSWVTVAHQAYGSSLGGDLAQRTRIVGWREAWALLGVVVASVLPSAAGLAATAWVFGGWLLLGLAAWAWAGGRLSAGPDLLARPAATVTPRPAGQRPGADLVQPLADARFRRLLAVFVVNGMASAVPATLVLFFVRDRLQAADWEPLFLATYFLSAAAALPLWVRLSSRLGAARAWALGMLLSVLAFVWAAGLGAGDRWAFLAVCVASGVALGADLSLPGALLTGVIRRAAASRAAQDATYLGWWNVAAKLNLALAAGATLPVLQWAGYVPGQSTAQGLQALGWVYAALPCGLKLLAAGLLVQLWLRRVGRHDE